MVVRRKLNRYDPISRNTCKSRSIAAALSLGWHLSVIGELYEKKFWDEEKLASFAKQVLNGALVNRAASEAKTGAQLVEAVQEHML